MSTEIIKVLDDLAARFGVAIDWTAENIMPYLKDVISRITIYKIVSLSIAIGVSMLWLAIITPILVKCIKNDHKTCIQKKENTVFWHYETYHGMPKPELGYAGCFAATVIGVVGFVAFFVAIGCTSTLLKWIIVPELPLIEEVMSLLPSAAS